MFKKDVRIKVLEDEIDDLVSELHELDSTSDEYKKKLEMLDKVSDELVKLKDKPRFSPDAILGFLANILGIVLILHHEEFNVITSKATSFVSRMGIKSGKK